MQKTAKDIMQSQVVTVSPDAPLHSTQRLFYEEGIHGAPVVDEQGRVVGMITSTDILRAATEAEETAPSGPATSATTSTIPAACCRSPRRTSRSGFRTSPSRTS